MDHFSRTDALNRAGIETKKGTGKKIT